MLPSLEEAETDALALLTSDGRMMAGIDGFEVTRVRVDEQGFSHVRVQQLLGEVPVFGGEAIVHLEPSGVLFTYTDDFKRDLLVDLTPALTPGDAADILIKELKGQGRLDAPTVELRVWRGPEADHLVYVVEVQDLENPHGATAPVRIISAHTGEILAAWEGLEGASLQDSDKVTWDAKRSTRLNRAVIGTDSDSDLLTSHNAVASTLSYMATSVGRDSYDGNGAVVNAYGHYGRNVVNAYWDGSQLLLGDGDGVTSNYLGVLDIVAHEFGHALTDYEANLTYSYESGALNEAASDILAAAVEADVDGGVNADTWDIGEDCWLASSALRYMDGPSDDGSSRDHYSNRYTGSQDNGGVHWNSGIANHWFYLLSEGGQHHTAGYRSGYVVTGIGIDDAYAIWYKALTDYMTSSTDFAGARTATESACVSLGYATTVCDEVSVAWYEVGVGSDPGGTNPPDTGDTGTVDTGTVDTGTPPVSCPSGYSEVLGTLSQGSTDQYTYTSSTSGTHDLLLYGATGTDFDLYLYQANKKGRYNLKSSSATASSDEAISYSGTKGDYRIDVKAYSGTGDYTLCYSLPQ